MLHSFGSIRADGVFILPLSHDELAAFSFGGRFTQVVFFRDHPHAESQDGI